LKNFVDNNGNAYQVDLKQFKSLHEAKVAVLSVFETQLNKINAKMNEQIMKISDPGLSPESLQAEKIYSKLLDRKNQILSTQKEVGASFDNITFDKASFNAISGINNNLGGSGGSSKKEVEDLDLQISRYKTLEDAITNVNNALDMNKQLQEIKTGQDRVKLIEQEVSLLNQKKQSLEALQAEQRRERAELENTLRNQGFNIDGQGLVNNYSKILNSKQNWANSASGEEKERRKQIVEDLKNTVDKYTELVHNSMASTLKDITAIEKEVQDVRRSQISQVQEIEKQYNDMYKKMVDERINAINKEKDARIKSIQDARNEYSKANDEEDFNKQLNKEQQTLLQLQAQIQSAQRDTSRAGQAKLQALINEAKAQESAIDEMVLQRQRKLNEDMFQEQEDNINNLADEQIKQLQETFSETNIAKIVAKALESGVITDINNKVVSLKDFYLTWSEQFGSGLSIISDQIETEFVAGLDTALSTVKDLSTALKDLNAIDFGNVNTGSFKTLTDLLGSIDISSILPSIKSSVVLPEATTSTIKATSKDGVGINISFDNLINVTGDIGELGEDSISKMTQIAKDAVSELSTKLKNQFSQLGLA